VNPEKHPPPNYVENMTEEGLHAYEEILADRIPDADPATWALFTFVLGAGRRAEAFLANVVREFDLDGSQLSVLLVLWFTGPSHRVSPTNLSKRIAQSPSGMTHTVKRLTAAGLVTRVGLETDGRAKHVQLTPKGEEVVSRCAQELTKALEELFPREEMPVNELASAMRQVVDVLARQFEGQDAQS